MNHLILLVAGWTSGISIYLTVFILGVAGRANWIELPGNLETLSHPVVLAAAFFMFVIEFITDKVPVVDSMWDSVHTFIRPAGALYLGFMGGGDQGLVMQTVYAILTGAIALETHASKASLRLAINTSPEPFSNVAASLVENATVVILFWIFIKHPVAATIIVILLTAGSVVVLRMLWRFGRQLFRRKAISPRASP